MIFSIDTTLEVRYGEVMPPRVDQILVTFKRIENLDESDVNNLVIKRCMSSAKQTNQLIVNQWKEFKALIEVQGLTHLLPSAVGIKARRAAGIKAPPGRVIGSKNIGPSTRTQYAKNVIYITQQEKILLDALFMLATNIVDIKKNYFRILDLDLCIDRLNRMYNKALKLEDNKLIKTLDELYLKIEEFKHEN